MDITLSSEAFHNYMNAAMVHVNRALKLVIRLFLVEDLVDSLKVSCCAGCDSEVKQEIEVKKGGRCHRKSCHLPLKSSVKAVVTSSAPETVTVS